MVQSPKLFSDLVEYADLSVHVITNSYLKGEIIFHYFIGVLHAK